MLPCDICQVSKERYASLGGHSLSAQKLTCPDEWLYYLSIDFFVTSEMMGSLLEEDSNEDHNILPSYKM